MLKTLRAEASVIVAAVSVAILYTIGKTWLEGQENAMLLGAIFVWLFIVMLWSSFTAVGHADALAELLGEPLGTLVLTLSVVCIEASIIAAVMLHAGPNPTLARDTMLAVLMIVLNGMVGLALLIGGFRHREQSYNLQGARSYLSVLITLATLSLILPRFTVTTHDPTLSPAQGLFIGGFTLLLYATFLAMQTVRHRDHYVEAVGESQVAADAGHEHGHVGGEPRSLAYHASFLLLTLVALVLLSKKLAIVVDFGTEALGLPEALGGLLVAVLVLSPEGLASLRAAAANHLQRAVNICLGSSLATVSLTVPAVVVIGMLGGIRVQLGLAPTELVLLVLTLFLSVMTFGAVRTNMLQGAVHLVVFFAYLVLIFQP